MNAPFRLPEAAAAASPSADDRFAFAILKDGAWTALAFFPTQAATWRAYDRGKFDDAMSAAYPFDRYDVREIIPDPAPATLPPGDLVIDIDIPDGMYDGLDVLTAGLTNAERKAADDARFDASAARQAWGEGD
jgi:hypothetical protein